WPACRVHGRRTALGRERRWEQPEEADYAQWRRERARLVTDRQSDRVRLDGVYGGFFGAALGVMLLATLGLFLEDRFAAINALKQLLALLISAVAALWFVAFGPVAWQAVGLVGAGSLLGGVTGVTVARRLPPGVLRVGMACFALAVAVRMLV
ncbi:MAG TPA: sulfite exporter TauE/SafE family protein, partial [Candidatus Dormibacteraeota bacterium]|nr:sulfite exporter TauE/SafE family protein [Candidatus Dormibacteraeota bacterium]